MLTIALVAVLTALALTAISFLFLNRRAAKVSAVRANIDEHVAAIQRKDAENDADMLANLMSGMPPDECLRRYQDSRQSLLPIANLQNPADWSADALESYRKRRSEEDVEKVNRAFFAPVVFTSLALVAFSLVVCTVLYQFSSAGRSPSLGTSAVPAAIPSIDSFPAIPAIPAPAIPDPVPLPATLDPADAASLPAPTPETESGDLSGDSAGQDATPSSDKPPSPMAP